MGFGVLLDDHRIDLNDRASNVKRAPFDVDVPPTECTQLTPSRSGGRCQPEKDGQRWILHFRGGDEPSHIRWCGNVQLSAVNAWRRRGDSGIRCDPTPANGLVQRTA
jgi:hypothetical protein